MPRFRAVFLYATTLLFLCAFILPVHADTITDLQNKISARNVAIEALEKEIAGYQNEIEKVGKEAKSLQGTIRTIDLEQKKLATDIKLTENRIEAVTLTISQLSSDISVKGDQIVLNRKAMGSAMRSLDRMESLTVFEMMLGDGTLSSFWDGIDTLERFEGKVKSELGRVQELKSGLEEQKAKTEVKRKELTALRAKLSDQRQILNFNKNEKNKLLSETKNKESEYKKQLAQKVALRDSFAQELLEFESQLKFEIDPSRLPQTGSGVLKWPLDTVKITQYFGNTAFAKSGAYNGKGHNGIDLKASIGTPIKAALSGKVIGTGNTDAVCPGASYGKWVLIEHGNGLSTLYAHFSLIKVSEGQELATGELLGYSGDTGYATGPHLHFTVYATQGVRVMERKSAVCKGTYTMPIADLKAYLDPLKYL